MNYVNLNKQKVSEITLGLMRIPDKSADEILALLDAAEESGVNMLDIADIYGGGRCEENLGAALRQRPGLRDRFFIQSKCGIYKKGVASDGRQFTYFDFSKDHILEAVDSILERLGTDHIEALLLHRPDVLMEPEEIAEAFTILHNQGKVGCFGVSNQNPMQMELLRKSLSFPIVANQLQLSCAFTPMIDAGLHVNMQWDAAVVRDGSVLEYCRLHDITIQAWSVMQHGYFDGVFLGSDKYTKLNATLDAIAARKSEETGRTVTSMAVALAWILRLPLQMQAVVGTTKPSRVKEAAAACDIKLSREEWYDIYLSAGNVLP